MEQKYKLKVEARQFFDKKLHTEIKNQEFWYKQIIPIELLDEVDMVYVDYGHEKYKHDSVVSSDLKGWSSTPKGAELRFAIKVQDIEIEEYEKIDIPTVMDKIQSVMNLYFKKNHL